MQFLETGPRTPSAGKEKMEDIVSIGPNELINLLPILLEFIEKKGAKETVDPEETVRKIAKAFGISDLAEFTSGKIAAALSEQIGEENAKKLASIIVSIGIFVAKNVSDYVKGNLSPNDLVNNLDGLYADKTGMLIDVVKSSFAIELPPGTEKLLARYSLDALAVYCFITAYKIYEKASDDARIAHENRLVIERRCRESVAGYERYHLEMETLVDKYLGTRIDFFESGINAMDSAILADDADGYIAANASLQESLGRHQQFHTQKEFDDLMGSDDVFKL